MDAGWTVWKHPQRGIEFRGYGDECVGGFRAVHDNGEHSDNAEFPHGEWWSTDECLDLVSLSTSSNEHEI